MVVTGEPPAFCAGADLSQLGASQAEGLKRIYQGFLRFGTCPLPTIAAVNGAAVGAGMNLALVCDVRMPPSGPGSTPGSCSSASTPAAATPGCSGASPARRPPWLPCLLGEVMDGREAERVGLVHRCVAGRRAARHRHRDGPQGGRGASRAGDEDQVVHPSTWPTSTIHDEAVDRELEPQVWSLNQPAFKERLAALQKKISSKADRATRRRRRLSEGDAGVEDLRATRSGCRCPRW